MAKKEDLERLARRAAGGDIVAARRLVAALEGKGVGRFGEFVVSVESPQLVRETPSVDWPSRYLRFRLLKRLDTAGALSAIRAVAKEYFSSKDGIAAAAEIPATEITWSDMASMIELVPEETWRKHGIAFVEVVRARASILETEDLVHVGDARTVMVTSSPFLQDQEGDEPPPWMYEADWFCHWVWETLMDDRRRPVPGLDEALEFARGLGFTVVVEATAS